MSTPVSTGPRVIGGGGEHDLRDRLAQRLRFDLERVAFDRRDRREVVRIHAADRRFVARADELHLLRPRRQRQRDLLGRQRVHEVGEQPRRHGDRALFLDLAADPAAQRDVKIRRRQLDAAVLGRDQHVRRDRKGASQRDRPPDDAKAPRQVLLETRNLHCAHLCNHFAGSIRRCLSSDNRSTHLIIWRISNLPNRRRKEVSQPS